MSSEETPNNKLFWIFSAIALAVVGIAVTLVVVFMMPSGEENQPDSTESSEESYVITATPPAVTDVVTAVEGSDITFNVTTDRYDSTAYYLEYEIADESRVVKDTGYERSNEFAITTKITDSSSYRLKVRLSDKERTSEWSESFTVKISDVEGVQSLQPTAAYFETTWAKGEGDEEDLKEAMVIAYNATLLSEFSSNSCIPLNTGNMAPGLLLPPVPGVFPKGLTLSFNVNSFNPDTSEASVSYYWCSE